jgi:FtsH-binding integral membrane protein
MQDYTNRNKSTARAAGFGTAVDVDQGLRSYMLQVYNYMAGALALSGLVAFFVGTNETLMSAIFGTPLAFVVMLAPIGFVWFYSARMHTMTLGGAQAGFWAFSALMGLSMAYIFAIYTGASIARVFFITASVFGSMSLYGYTTKKDLSGWGSFLIMGLFGIIIASLVNIFLKSSALDFAVSAIGVLVFVGLTAYDTQRIKQTYYQLSGDTLAKASIMGALSLYMDFINLFMMMLRLFGNRR